MDEIISKIEQLEIEEIEKLIKIAESLIAYKKEKIGVMNNESTNKNVTRSKHPRGKIQRITMMENSKVIRTFPTYTKCVNYLKDELGIKNAPKKLRSALDENKRIRNYKFIITPEED